MSIRKITIMTYCMVAILLAMNEKVYNQEERVEPAVKVEVPVSGEAQEAEAQEAFDKGIENYRQSKYDEAIAEFKKAVEIEPNYAKAYCEIGIAYMKKEDLEGAIPNILK